MKKSKSVAISVLFFLLIISYQNSVAAERENDLLFKDSMNKVEELKHETELALGDTINFIDKNGLRQGYWKLYGSGIPYNTSYAPTALVKEGRYVDSKEEGEWIFYNPDGSIMKKVNYKAGVIAK
ncbi:MAG TPA: hypothetical protein VFJ43_12975 [Bacteroidia bacterium]|nr:hypothetical protein [Bacteroidia bacterium]